MHHSSKIQPQSIYSFFTNFSMSHLWVDKGESSLKHGLALFCYLLLTLGLYSDSFVWVVSCGYDCYSWDWFCFFEQFLINMFIVENM